MKDKLVLKVPDVANVSCLICELMEANGIEKNLGTIGCFLLVCKVLYEKGNSLEEAKEYISKNIGQLWEIVET